MNLTGFSLRNPYIIIALLLVITALGIFAFLLTPTDLFPNTIPPQVSVITVHPGATAGDVADKITQLVEKELNSISGLNQVVSTSRDEVSAVNAEFLYDKPIGEAVIDVQSAINRIRASLPTTIMEPRIYRITDATRPLLTLALRPLPGSTKTLPEIRLLAENQIMDAILRVPGIADVDVFGGYKPEITVQVDREKLFANNLTLTEVVGALAKQNVSAPAGTIYLGKQEVLLRTVGEFSNLENIRKLPIARAGDGLIRVRDIARVALDHQEQRSFYHGNGKAAIAINVMRPDRGPTIAAIKNFKAFLPMLKATYQDIGFEITDDQQPLIDINVQGMRLSLGQAIVLTILVVFLFLGNLRAAIVVSVSIPLAFLTSLVVLWFSPYTLNMVTLSGLIISVGMVVDAAVVMLENIYRHFRQMKDPSAIAAAREGANEVSLAITAGMLTTVIVLIPVMFTGGFTQQTMRPLNMMISCTMVASLLVALAVIPLLSAKLLDRSPSRQPSRFARILGVTDRGVSLLARVYLGILKIALRSRVVTLILAVLFLLCTMRFVPPIIGGELMTPMDTGIAIVEFSTPSTYTPKEVEGILGRVEEMIYKQPGIKMVSARVGSEPGQISFGGGGATAQTARLTIHMVDRLHREQTIWQIEDRWREELRHIPGVFSSRVSEYGATPLSTTKAPLNVIISGPDSRILDRLADQCLKKLRGQPGLVDVRRSWYFDKREQRIVIDPSLARFYGTSPATANREIKGAIKGIPATTMRLTGSLDIPIRVKYATKDISTAGAVDQIYIPTRFGPLPLRAMGRVSSHRGQPFITREELHNTIDITGQNHTYTIAQAANMAGMRLKKIQAPAGYTIKVAGSAADMQASKAKMGKALMIGVILLYFLLLAMFKSFCHPFTIMAAIPLAVSGGMWGLLLFDKPMCKPAMMGLILLGGTIVNNSILLLDFIFEARKRGMTKDEAIMEAVRLRIRPILMTTVSTVVGLTPLIFELAVGLERMSPLGIVAATGLACGTFMTMVVIPVVYSSMDSAGNVVCRLASWLFLKRETK